MASAEMAKVALSTAEQAVVSVPLPDGTRADVPLSRGEFEAAIQPLLRRMWAPMERAGSAVFLQWADRWRLAVVTANAGSAQAFRPLSTVAAASPTPVLDLVASIGMAWIG